jgi:hypothetical protein
MRDTIMGMLAVWRYLVVFSCSSSFNGKCNVDTLDGLYRGNMWLCGVCDCNGYGEDG